MTNPSPESKHPKRDLLLSLWESVLREQLPEGMYPWWQRLNALAQAWPSQESDQESQAFLDELAGMASQGSLSAETSFYLRRALTMTRWLDRAFTTDPIDPPWSTLVQLPETQAVAAELKAAGMRPLRARPYPPYPQLVVACSNELPDPTELGFYGGFQQEPVLMVSNLLAQWDSRLDCPQELARQVRGHLVRYWQHDAGLTWDSDAGTEVIAYAGPASWAFSRDTVQNSMAAFNDCFADALHIDPRFANFIPFSVGQGLQNARDPSQSASAWLKETVSSADLFDALRSTALRLIEVLALHQRFARYGPRTLGLHSRLSLSNTEMSVDIEHEGLRQHLAQCAHHILSLLSARGTQTYRFSESLTPDCGQLPRSILPLPPQSRGVAYTSSAQLLLDLKQLHQAVGEVYGGVAFTPAVRRMMVLAGLTRLHGKAESLTSNAPELEDFASEIGLRAGLLRQPLAAMSPAAALEAAQALSSAPQRLASTFDAGSLSENTRNFLAYLRCARWLLANLDPEAVNCLLLTDVTSSSEVVSALALMQAIDAEPMPYGNPMGNGLMDRMGLVIGISLSADATCVTELVSTLLVSPAFKAYSDSRGGHVEILIQRETGGIGPSAFPAHPSVRDLLRLRATSREVVKAAKGTVVTYTFVTNDASGIRILLACMPRGTVNQHLRAIVPADLSRLIATTTHGVRQLFDAPLSELTRQSWLNREAESPEAVTQEREAQAAIEAAWAALLAQHADAGVRPESHAEWFEAIAPWFGARYLASLADARFVATAFGIVADSMQRMHPRRLSAFAWRTLPKGAYSLLYPGVEQAWREAAEAVRAAGHWPETQTLSQSIENGEAILGLLATDE